MMVSFSVAVSFVIAFSCSFSVVSYLPVYMVLLGLVYRQSQTLARCGILPGTPLRKQITHDVEVAGPTPVVGVPFFFLHKADVAELMERLVHCPPCASAHSCDGFPRWPTVVGRLVLVSEQAAIDSKGSWRQPEVENPVAHHEESVSFWHVLTSLF